MYSKPKNKEQYKWNTRKFHAKLIRTTFFLSSLNAATFLKQLNDRNQSFKVMKISISSTNCRSVLQLLRRTTLNSLPDK